MTSKLLPQAEWTFEPDYDDAGQPTGGVVVGAWARDGVREFALASPPNGPIERPADALTFAKVDGPPDDWFGLRAFDLDTGLEVKGLVEVDTVAGYVLFRHVDANGTPTSRAVYRREGRFEIRRPDE